MEDLFYAIGSPASSAVDHDDSENNKKYQNQQISRSVTDSKVVADSYAINQLPVETLSKDNRVLRSDYILHTQTENYLWDVWKHAVDQICQSYKHSKMKNIPKLLVTKQTSRTREGNRVDCKKAR